MSDRSPPSSDRRIVALDVVRGIALLAMASYHAGWDFEFFEYLSQGTTGHGAWKLYARAIASSFLLIAGASLVLAHSRGIRWRSFWRREAQVAAGAIIISVATYFFTPNAFVFFGILHQMAVGGLIALAFIRAPLPVTIAVGLGLIALPWLFSTSITDPRWLAWIGLAEHPPVSSDLVPIAPWTGVMLIGLAAGRIMLMSGGWEALRRLNDRLKPAWPLALIGRHSLLFYLLHQPILIALVWLLSQVAPPDRLAIFDRECRQTCSEVRDEAFCRSYCDCARDGIAAEGLIEPFLSGNNTPEQSTRVNEIAGACSAKIDMAR
ncbi:DUF1624 domain-containing protein [Consotaella salsifontis]|uniref:Uncharacterized membrane protein n=1 Tax=Consotaella salsifontis TaxID=1365950 RepID=A0A1T4SZR0_9HYPH|nr:heparan-alpha-glucosaminide N-acetyltransferase [Consotaella salsifontis]SKA33461.1 Uncharacterized membrane protein [Consotaella salsifontis]